MKQNNQTFIERYASMTPTERNRFNVQVMERCNVSLWAIQTWKTGLRVPKSTTKEIIAEILDSKPSILFPNETSVQSTGRAEIA